MDEVYLGRYESWGQPLSKYSSLQARGSRGGKRHPYDYFARDNGSVRRQKVEGLAKILPPGPIYRRKEFICATCGRKSVFLVKKNTTNIKCPYCN